MVRTILLVTVAIAGATWSEAESVDVKYYGKLDLGPFACTDVTRSSFIDRSCYDKTKQFMVVQLKGTYYPYCEIPPSVYETFLNAPSMGRFYTASIKETGIDGPFDCRTHAAPKY